MIKATLKKLSFAFYPLVQQHLRILKVARYVQGIFSNSLPASTNSDVIGVETLVILKNIIAVGAECPAVWDGDSC